MSLVVPYAIYIYIQGGVGMNDIFLIISLGIILFATIGLASKIRNRFLADFFSNWIGIAVILIFLILLMVGCRIILNKNFEDSKKLPYRDTAEVYVLPEEYTLTEEKLTFLSGDTGEFVTIKHNNVQIVKDTTDEAYVEVFYGDYPIAWFLHKNMNNHTKIIIHKIAQD